MEKSRKDGTLHELTSKSFNRTSRGLVFTDDLKTVFSLLLICLKLEDNTNTNKSFLSTFINKQFPFTFSVSRAIDQMENLEIEVNMNTTCINISYSIKPEMAHYLLKVFMAAKLLHTPADRTRTKPKEKVLLQPTPKGVFILQKYVRTIGLKEVPSILTSTLNSMKLFTFERSSLTDVIIKNDHLLNILLSKILGTSPNIWSPNVINEKLPTLAELLEYSNDIFSFENVDYSKYDIFDDDVQEHVEVEVPWIEKISPQLLNDKERKSPLAHRFFTNPDSDAHIQYYVSEGGLRLYPKKFSKNNQNSDGYQNYYFSSKALWQWLMDCTDILYPEEASLFAVSFASCGLIIPIENKTQKFKISKSQYYRISEKCLDLLHWKPKIKNSKERTFSDHSSLNGKSISIGSISDKSDLINRGSLEYDSNVIPLEKILKDPGMRYLFRKHLNNEFCSENLDSYIEIKKFLKKMVLLKKIIDSKSKKTKRTFEGKHNSYGNNINTTIDSALRKQANQCLELGYHIYSLFIMIGSPYQINIEYCLRESITNVLLGSSQDDNDTVASESIIKTELINEEHGDIKNNNNKINEPVFTKRDIKPVPLNLNTEDVVSIEAKSMRSESIHKATPVGTASNSLSNTLCILKQLFPLFEVVEKRIYYLMKTDSLPKFIDSEIYKDVLALDK